MTDADVPVVVVTGPRSGTGKTTLIEALVRELTGRGVRVGYVKRAHHGVDPDTPGKDTHRVRAAGAAVAVLASLDVATVFVPQPSRDPRELARLATANADVDVVLVEGGRECIDLPRIAVVPSGEALEEQPVGLLLAVVGTAVRPPRGVPLVAPGDAATLADLVPTRRLSG